MNEPFFDDDAILDLGDRDVVSPSRDVIEALGPLRHQLRPSRANLVAGLILTSLLIGGGVTGIVLGLREAWIRQFRFPIYAEHGMCWTALFFGSLLFCWLVFVGTWPLRWVIQRWALQVDVYERGFEWRFRGTIDRYLWDDIDSIQEFRPDMPDSNDFVIRLTNEREIRLTKNDLRDHRILGKIAVSEARARGIPVRVT